VRGEGLERAGQGRWGSWHQGFWQVDGILSASCAIGATACR
jgi:hypothetical protein